MKLLINSIVRLKTDYFLFLLPPASCTEKLSLLWKNKQALGGRTLAGIPPDNSLNLTPARPPFLLLMIIIAFKGLCKRYVDPLFKTTRRRDESESHLIFFSLR